ncbi:MAG: phosphoenolpyruvate--protein phosphotransferase [Spirochaetes bacterium]|nr:phosphoenolpyruvate--protein phosphotransferase [Spirochaetota bacterium]
MSKAHIYKGDNIVIPKYSIQDSQVENEIFRFKTAIRETSEDIKKIEQQMAVKLSKDMASIFSSHLMVLEDPLIKEKAIETVKKEKRNIEWVLNDIAVELLNGFSAIEDDYLKERMVDLTDINKRLIGKLMKTDSPSLSDLDRDVIVFSSDMTPSDTAIMNKKHVLAFVTDKGGRTSHTAIMARALEIPAIVGTINATQQVKEGDLVIVDAIHGKVIIDPTESEITDYRLHLEELKRIENFLSEFTHLPSVTHDDVEVSILGNIEFPDEMNLMKSHGAQGIGLFRSEFLFIGREISDEETQFNEYKSVIEFFNPLPVTVRTLDIGGDKVHSFNYIKEKNPALGCRAIRFCLENPDLFKTQLRAILRASHYGNAKLMFPMISTLEELLKAKEITYEIMDDLKREKIPFNKNIPIGIMIEVPSAAINADQLSKYSDFFSIGTNDLVQYTLAVDRINEKIAYLYNPINTAVLRLLKNIVDVSKKNSIPVSICGEIAGEPKYTMLLLGMGFRALSMSPTFFDQIKRIIRSIRIKECEALARDILSMETADKIEEKLLAVMSKKFPNIFI